MYNGYQNIFLKKPGNVGVKPDGEARCSQSLQMQTGSGISTSRTYSYNTPTPRRSFLKKRDQERWIVNGQINTGQ